MNKQPLPFERISGNFSYRTGVLGIVLLGTILRFWHLGMKPLWIDELYTSFYSLGQNPDPIPLNQLFSLHQVQDLLSLAPQSSIFDASAAVTRYGNHPPLFFMVMHLWIHWAGVRPEALRIPAAIAGVLMVWAVAGLGQQVAGKSVGLTAALLMAVSPYAVYLSQEARHYTLPMLVSVLALVQWLKIIQQVVDNRACNRKTLTIWSVLNGLGVYLHYFYLIAWGVQLGVLVLILGRKRSSLSSWVAILMASLATGILLSGLILVISQQVAKGGDVNAEWITFDRSNGLSLLMPLLRTLAASIFMVILLPVEQVPVGVSILSGALMLGIWGWGIGQVWQGWRGQLTLASVSTQILLWAIVAYAVGMLAAILGIVYGLNRDLTLAPRYFFLLYPVVSVLLAVGWAKRQEPTKTIWGFPAKVWVVAGLVSIFLMGLNLTVKKPFLPEQVAARIAQSQPPIVVMMAAPEPVQRLIGFSYALALPPTTPLWWEFRQQFPQAEADGLLDLRPQTSRDQAASVIPQKPRTLWLLEINRLTPFPLQVKLARQTCHKRGDAVNTTGTDQQAYECRL